MPSLGARWLFDGTGRLYQDALLAWEEDRIVAVEPGMGWRAERHFGQALVIPGLVNAHTHLDLSDLCADTLPRQPCAWLSRVIEHRRRATPDSIRAAVRRGIRESLQHGVTLVGDIAATAHTLEVLQECPLRATVFVETLGLSKFRARASWQSARSLLATYGTSSRYRLGISPHAPYSTRRGLFRLASQCGIPLAVHCAEFSEEHELLATQSGPFRSWLESLGAWDPDALVPSHEQLLHWLAPAPQLLLVHLNYPNPAVLEILRDWAAQRKVAVVYCPRTHAYFGHSPHPWLSLLDRGVPVILGTDSRASNPDLNVLAELRWLWRQGCPLSPAQLLRLVTHTAAQLLGWPQAGSLVPGSFADFLVFSLAEVEHGDPLRTLLEVNAAPQHVYIAGEVIHSAS